VTTRQLTYRTGGAITRDERIGGSIYDYGYNARGRMVTATQDSVLVGEYGYDAFGRRVWRETHGAGALHIHYIFDPDGRLLAEHDATTGDVLREYVWLDDMPLAIIDYSGGSAATYYIHLGQIGEPLAVTDGSKVKVWDAAMAPFGEAVMFGPASLALDLRLPGQWAQAETGGLFQNWMRDYDPTLGRYAQADPLGIDGGDNLYGYALASPLAVTDPTGEIAPIVLGALIGGGLDLGIQLLENGGRFECVHWDSVAVSAVLGAVGGGIGGRTLVKAAGKEWSHFIPARFFRTTSKSYKPWLPKWLNNNRFLNGNYVTPQRHYSHDIFRFPQGWRLWGKRLPPEIAILNRAPDWAKGSILGGFAGATSSMPSKSKCGC
jgi:RHS repeat-associated protein